MDNVCVPFFLLTVKQTHDHLCDPPVMKLMAIQVRRSPSLCPFQVINSNNGDSRYIMSTESSYGGRGGVFDPLCLTKKPLREGDPAFFTFF